MLWNSLWNGVSGFKKTCTQGSRSKKLHVRQFFYTLDHVLGRTSSNMFFYYIWYPTNFRWSSFKLTINIISQLTLLLKQLLVLSHCFFSVLNVLILFEECTQTLHTLLLYTCRVDRNISIKVADFGLTRDIYQTNYYSQRQHAKIPVKWMSPESLHDRISNEKTDVVSQSRLLFLLSLF